jgi:hypothetical protein
MNKFDLTDWANKEAQREIKAAETLGNKTSRQLSRKELFSEDGTFVDTEVVWGLTPTEMKEAIESLENRLRRTKSPKHYLSRKSRARREEVKRLLALANARWAAARGMKIRWM